ncbi:MAG TPA: acetamidase/formamidase family protein [Candidatus Methylomirabilis sp.]|nr:acetamidase/formamidase family protein [Candidatus Methylomirabilis sp.]
MERKGVRSRIVVEEYTGGLIGPSLEMIGTLKDGGTISTVSPPGCWGPMITPEFVGGHEVSRPVAVEGAQVGDAVALFIQKVWVRSQATSSGTMITKAAAFGSDPFVDKHCPNCKTPWPASRIEGTGPECVRCVKCGAECSPFAFEEGYTIAFDDKRRMGLTVDEKGASDLASRAYEVAALPKQARQHPILLYKPHTIPGTLSRLQSFIGNIGTIPSKDMPDSHNAGDFGSFLVGANHRFGLTQAELAEHRTDCHLDCNAVRAGAVLICPVKVEGAGIYIGDSHANQGDGELSLHTTDITADVTVKVKVIKGLKLEGPVLLPVPEDLPGIARPYTKKELEIGQRLARQHGVTLQRKRGPIQVIGTGPTINEATDNAIGRAARLLGMTQPEVRNRCTITGAVEIARLPGAVQLTILAPLPRLDEIGLGKMVRRQYGIA